MATRWGAPPFAGLEKRDDAWDLVVKVKYSDTLKRFNAHVNDSHFDHDLAALRSKIASAFKFSSDVEFFLTYTDEDGDVVMLDDENDLRDAAINQKLNPLRINVQLKNINTKAPRTEHQALNSRSPRPIALEDQLAQVKSAIDEALKVVPEQVSAVFSKLSHDFRSRAASSVPSLVELLDQLATLMKPKGNIQTSSGPVNDSSRSFSSGSQTSRNTKIKHENELMTGSTSQSPVMQNACCFRSVVTEDPKAQDEQASVHSLIFTSSGGKKYDRKERTDTERKIRCAFQSKGKSATSSTAPPFSSRTYAATPIQHTPAPSISENKLTYWPSNGYNGLVSDGMQSRVRPVAPPYYRHLGSNGNINRDWQPSFVPPPTDMCSSPKLDMPSSVGTSVPSKDGLYSLGSSYKYDGSSSVSNNPEGRYSFECLYNYGSIPQLTLHEWVQCDGCGVTPIVGPRYKSNVKDDYDLCDVCFFHMGNESEYTRLDKPASVNNRKFLGRLQQEQGGLKLQYSFISDITIPDGTSMAPSNLFTKIWRLRNSGCTVWPFGTQVIWFGGDQFAVQSVVKLGISVNGVAEGQEVDVAVDFLAPAKPGRYISFWRLALPSGEQFGRLIWVHIRVEEPCQTSGSKLSSTINLNLPQQANSTALKPSIDMNSGSMNPFFQYPLNIYNEMPPCYYDSAVHLKSESEPDSWTDPNFQYTDYGETFAYFQEPVIFKESESASSMPPFPATVKQVQIPTTDHHTSSGDPALTSIAAAVPAPETIPLPKSVSFASPISASSVWAPSNFPGHIPTSVPTAVLPNETVSHKEEELLWELKELGFGEFDLNKEILRRNKYDLELSFRELCGLDD